MAKKTTIKVSGTPDQINDVIDFLPQDAIIKTGKKMKDSEAINRYHQFIKLNASFIKELAEVEREEMAEKRRRKV